MERAGNITKITRKNKAGTPPTVRYRYRLGREGKPVFYKTRKAAVAHQKAVIAAQKAKGNSAMDVLQADTLGHVMTALGVLKTSGLNSEHLVQACRSYSAAISTTALTVTLGQAVDEAMQTPRYQSLRPSSKRNLKYRWGRLVKYIDADTPLGAVSVVDIEGFLAKQTAGSQHKYHVDLGVLWNVYFLKQLRHVSTNIMQQVVTPMRVESARRMPYSYDELVSILDQIEPFSELDRLIQIHFQTGLRSSECMGLTTNMFQIKRELIYLPHGYSKTKMDRNVMLTPALLEYIKACNLPDGRLFSSPYRTLVDSFKQACKAAVVEPKGMTGRQTFISMAFEGLFESNMSKLQAHCGHSIGSSTTVNFYLNASNPDDVKKYFHLPLRRVNETAWSDLVAPHDPE